MAVPPISIAVGCGATPKPISANQIAGFAILPAPALPYIEPLRLGGGGRREGESWLGRTLFERLSCLSNCCVG